MIEPKAMLYPSFTLFILTVLVLLKSFWVRTRALQNKEIKMSYFRHFLGDAPEKVQVHSRNFINLFELPVLFYVITLYIYQMGKVDPLFVNLGWAFVISRYLHSFFHLFYNNVNFRLAAYTVGVVTLSWMWIRFFILL